MVRKLLCATAMHRGLHPVSTVWSPAHGWPGQVCLLSLIGYATGCGVHTVDLAHTARAAAAVAEAAVLPGAHPCQLSPVQRCSMDLCVAGTHWQWDRTLTAVPGLPTGGRPALSSFRDASSVKHYTAARASHLYDTSRGWYTVESCSCHFNSYGGSQPHVEVHRCPCNCCCSGWMPLQDVKTTGCSRLCVEQGWPRAYGAMGCVVAQCAGAHALRTWLRAGGKACSHTLRIPCL